MKLSYPILHNTTTVYPSNLNHIRGLFMWRRVGEYVGRLPFVVKNRNFRTKILMVQLISVKTEVAGKMEILRGIPFLPLQPK